MRVGSERKKLVGQSLVWQSWLVVGWPALLASRAITAPDFISSLIPQSCLEAKIIHISSRGKMIVCLIPHQMSSASLHKYLDIFLLPIFLLPTYVRKAHVEREQTIPSPSP